METREGESIKYKTRGGMYHTLNCWVILVDEMALDQLDGKARFTNTTSTDDDELVLSEELLRGWSCQQKAGATREEAIRAI